MDVTALIADPAAWAALISLIVMEIVLGIDNLIFVSILTNKLPEAQRGAGRTIGLSLALIMRLALLTMIAWLVGLTAPVFDLGIQGPLGEHGEPTFDTAFSWRDLILIAGGIFLVWKATSEIHETMEPHEKHAPSVTGKAAMNFGAAIVQILILDIVFSIDSILTAVGMTDHLPIMFAAVIVAVLVMLLASGPLARFINANPTVVMLALGFLLMIGMVLIADGFGVHVPKGYVYTAMAFSAFVEILNLASRQKKNVAAPGATSGAAPPADRPE
jgi:predicted tellurium resistance membrane protein TerC